MWIRIKKEKKVRKLLFRSYRDLCSSKFNKRTGERKKESAVEKLKCCHIYFRERERKKECHFYPIKHDPRSVMLRWLSSYLLKFLFYFFLFFQHQPEGEKISEKKNGIQDNLWKSFFMLSHIDWGTKRLKKESFYILGLRVSKFRFCFWLF